MNDVDSGIDGRAISRELLAGWIAAWREGWLAAGRMQQENPAMMRLGLASPSDPAEAIGGILHVLACTHPQFQSAVVAMLEMVEEELVKDVPPLAHDSPVANDEHGEASDAPDRLAQLEERCERMERWHADLEDEVVRLRSIIGALGASVQVSRPTNVA